MITTNDNLYHNQSTVKYAVRIQIHLPRPSLVHPRIELVWLQSRPPDKRLIHYIVSLNAVGSPNDVGLLLSGWHGMTSACSGSCLRALLGLLSSKASEYAGSLLGILSSGVFLSGERSNSVLPGVLPSGVSLYSGRSNFVFAGVLPSGVPRLNGRSF